MGDENNFKRRDFLTTGALAGAAALVPTPIERLVDILSRGLIQNAHAEALGQCRLSQLHQYFDAGRTSSLHIRCVDANETVLRDSWNLIPLLATKYVSSGGKAAGTQYSTFSYRGTLVPHLFLKQFIRVPEGNVP